MFGQPMDAGVTKTGMAIRLVAPREADLLLIVTWLNDREVMRLLDPHARATTYEAELQRLRGWEHSDTEYVWNIEVDGACIGAAWINEIQRPEMTGEFGIMIGDKAYWNQGIATAVGRTIAAHAFTELGFNYLYVLAFGPNEASKRMAVKLGYEQYGIKPAAAMIDGLLCEGWEGALSRERWQGQRP